MDQVKVYLALLKKHHFWVMCGFIFITSIVVYSMGVGELETQTEARKSVINAAKSAQQEIRNNFQPNPKTLEIYQSKNVAVSRDVEAAWIKLYWTQRSQLVWPEDMKQLKVTLDGWPDTIPVTPFDNDLRRTFQNVMTQPNERARLGKIIQIYTETRVEAEKKGLVHGGERPRFIPGQGGGPNAQQEEVVTSGLVRWGSPVPQNTGVDNLFIYPWVSKTSPPTDLEMRYAQEDLWVYEFLLRALSKVNQGVDPTKPEKALLKEIVELRIGQQAASIPPTSNLVGDLAAIVGAVAPGPGQQGVSGMEGQGMGMNGPPQPGVHAGGIPGQPGTTATTNTDDLLKAGRYCDLNGNPIMATEFAEKIEKDQYRLMPVYMRLVINQQNLPALMTELTTAVMPMRIKQVQLYKSDPTAQAAPAQLAGPATDPRFSMDVGVEIRGFVHIYQLPNTKDFPHKSVENANPGAVAAPSAPTVLDPSAPTTGPIVNPNDPTGTPTVIVPEAVTPAPEPGAPPAGNGAPGAVDPAGGVVPPAGAAAPADAKN